MTTVEAVDIDIGYRPHEHQLEVHEAMQYHRFGVLVSHRRWGKTYLSANTLCDTALKCEKKNPRFAYVAPYLKQAKQIAWMYLTDIAGKVPGSRKSESELYLEFPSGARVTLYGADNAEAMRGSYFDGVVLDEYADIGASVWGEIIRPALADRKGWALFIGTPKGINAFYDLYQMAVKNPNWYVGLYRADETKLPWLDEKELALARSEMSDNQYRQEFMCDFNASSDNVLITIDVVSDAIKRSATVSTEAALRGLPKVLGVDVARYGDDKSVIQKRWGHVAFEPMCFDGIDNMELVGHVGNVIHQWKPDVVFIDGGRGEGVIDRLRQLGHDPIEIQFGSSPSDAHYADKRTEMWDTMATWLREGGCLPDNILLKGDLCAPTYGFPGASGRMRLEAKDGIKERIGRSPDFGDSLALTFALPVTSRHREHSRLTQYSDQPAFASPGAYDPFAVLEEL